jgi:hypothetical protein
MYEITLHIHSVLRWIVLLLVLEVTLKSLRGWVQKKEYTNYDNKISLFALIFTHTQLLVGFMIYFISPKVQFGDMANTMKDPVLRTFTVEHLTLMLIAIVLVTVGRIKPKKVEDATKKHKQTFIFFVLALLFMLVAIPWPFAKVAGSWF